MIWDLRAFSNKYAFIDDSGIKLSYRDLADEGERLSGYTTSRSLVCCLCQNSIGAAVGYVSFLNNGLIPMMLDVGMDYSMKEELIGAYKPDYIWLPYSQKNDFEDWSEIYSFQDYILLKTNSENRNPLNENLALLLTTSGSTGSQKFVRQSYKNISSNMKSIAEYLELDDNERPITVLPMNYTYGLSVINSHLYVGATVLITKFTVMQREFWRFFNEQKATSISGVPYTYEMLDRLKVSRMDIPSLSTMTQAGGKLSKDLHKKFADYAIATGRKFVVMYGQCEATARMSYLPHQMSQKKIGSIGIPIPGGEFKLIDDHGNEINEPYVSGELVYKGDNVTLGYALNRKDLEKGDERCGILETGDIAQRDEDGYFYIVGRKKRFLKIFGNRVNLDELEALVKEKFGASIACAGRDDKLTIFVTDHTQADVVREYASKKTKIHPSAFNIIAVNTIPKNESGKTLYPELEKLL